MEEQELRDKIRETSDIRPIDYEYLQQIIDIKQKSGEIIYFLFKKNDKTTGDL